MVEKELWKLNQSEDSTYIISNQMASVVLNTFVQ